MGVYFPSRLNVSIHIFWEGKKYDCISPQSPQTWQNGSLESGPDLVRPTPLPHSMLVCLQSLKIIHWVPTHDSTWVHTLAVLLKLGHTLGSPRAMCKHKFLGPGPRTTNSVGRRGGPRFSISNQLPSNVNVASPWPHLEQHCSRSYIHCLGITDGVASGRWWSTTGHKTHVCTCTRQNSKTM